ncbi:MAG: glycosyltransferase [Blastocatellia bacterium]|nr:glycosyltransferase [Blastocatellia bacterium]
MTTLPRISVIIPTYNRAAYLAEAVDSALAQRGVEVEVIIVDDGSTDDTADVVRRCSDRWGQRVAYLTQENAERSVARNHGLRRATAEYVAFLDSDDVWRETHAESCIAALRRCPEAIAAYSEYGLIDADGGRIRERVSRPIPDRDRLLRALCLKEVILHPTEVVLRRDRLGGDGLFDPEIPGAEDWLLWIELAGRAPMVSTGSATVWMRSHGAGTFGDPVKFARSLLLAAEKVLATGWPARLGLNQDRIRAINRAHCAYAFYLNGKTDESWRLLQEAAKVHRPILFSRDFRTVAIRLLAGPWLSGKIRAFRNRGEKRTAPPPAR